MAEIDSVREMLRPVATRASILYFVIADFANVDPMYQRLGADTRHYLLSTIYYDFIHCIFYIIYYV